LKRSGSLKLILRDSKGRVKSSRLLTRDVKRGKIELIDKEIHAEYKRKREEK